MNDDHQDQPTKPGNVIALSRYRARLGRGKRMRRIDTVLSLPNPERAIQALPGDELYYLLREDDPREAKELLAYATPEQVQIVLDFGLWSGDRLVPDRMAEWVAVMADMPFETIGNWIRGLDIELVALLIRKGARIYDLEIEDPPDEPAGMFFPTPDRFFVLDVVGYEPQADDPSQGDPEQTAEVEASASAHTLVRIIEALYRYDLNLARRILVGVKAELDSGLEEMALRWRQGRMADLGFIDSLEALEIYRELDPATVRIGELRPGTRMRPRTAHRGDGDGDDGDIPPDLLRGPGVLGDHLGGSSLFARALGRVTAPAELEELHFSIVALTNRLLSADRVDPADDEAVSAGVTRMRATLDLAVEFLARGVAGAGAGGSSGVIDEDRAVDAVRTVAMMRLFRLGVSLIGKVRALAQALVKRGPFAILDHLDLVEEPEATVLAAVNRARPLYPRLLDDPPAAGERPFDSLADIARVTAAIQRAAVAQAMLVGLGLRPEHLVPEALEGVTPSDAAAIDTAVLARTALVLLLSHAQQPRPTRGRPRPTPSFRPLTPAEISGLARPAVARPAVQPKRTARKKTNVTALPRPQALADDQEAKARHILEQVSPMGMRIAATEMTNRWLETLSPLETVLVRTKRRPKA